MHQQNASILADQQSRLIALVQTPGLLEVLRDLQTSVDAQNAAAADPRAFLASRNVTLADDVDVTVTRKTINARGSISICVSLGVISVCYNF